MFNINDQVLVTFKDKQYNAVIIDIEQCTEYSGIYQQYDKLVYSGRYGVRFIDKNPTLIDIPYFWENDLTLR